MFDIETIERRHHDGKTGDVMVKRVHIKTPTVDMDKRLVQGVCSTEDVDLDGDVVQQSGIDTAYFLGADRDSGVRTVYLDHDYSQPIGSCQNMKMTADGLYCATYITKLPIGDDILTLIQEGIVRGLSIGFRAQEATSPTLDESVKFGSRCDRIIRRSMLLEYSVTAMPANPGAMLELQSLVAKSRISKRFADMILPPVEVQPMSVLTTCGVYTLQ